MIASALLHQQLTIEPRVGESAIGPLFDEPGVTYPARIQPKRRQVRDAVGDITLSDAVAFLRPDAVVTVGDRATGEGTVYRVLDVATLMGLTRPEHLEITLGRSET